MQAIYIDTRSRNFIAHAVWVTQIAPGKLVIREAVELPGLPDSADLYIVDATGYSATSSDGFVEVFHGDRQNDFSIVGEILNERALRPVSPREVFIVKNGFTKTITTHSNSNVAVANTAYNALKDTYESIKNEVLVMEGQSDYTFAFSFKGDVVRLAESDDNELIFPDEHRQDIVNHITVRAAEIMDSHYWDYYWSEGISAKDKHDELLARVVATLMDKGREEFEIIEDLSRDVAAEIAQNMIRIGADLNIDRFSTDEEKEQATSILDNLVNRHVVDAQHLDGDNQSFTWAVPDHLIDKLSPGDRVTVDTRHGEAEVVISRVYRENSGRNRKYVIDKINTADSATI